eukprot:CAMPEP_0204567756 /NCGR_PEP_ID=MMETSP0661-20131031/36781_1 /ASSEMBLY_ACC=CAM_ASM_000606 /TAXON_ID=109239 /ORGANISM="Alexandrium margalefi, Strain AMGDE01CS-322" /LENGTH=190 /DNA_ID=CAMNT_0051575701 /DNA_START=56 /DNA_END=626 /DNA_ORIENTATION=+
MAMQQGAQPGAAAAATAEPAPGQVKAVVRGRVDVAIRTLMESYTTLIDAAAAAPRSETAVNDYALRVHAAAMSRAADELLRIAGEVGGAQAVSEDSSCLDDLASKRLLHLRSLEATSAELLAQGAGGPGWPLAASSAVTPDASEALAQAAPVRAGQQKRLFPPWMGDEAFHSGQGVVTVPGQDEQREEAA